MPDTADTEALKAGKAALKAGKAAHKLVEQYEQTKNTQEADKVRAADAWKKACDAWEAHRKGETMADFYEQTKPTPEGNKKQNLGWKTLARYAEVLPYLLKRPGRPVDGVTPPLAEIEGLMNDEGGTFRNTSWWSKAIVKEKQQEKKNTAAKKKADTVTDRGYVRPRRGARPFRPSSADESAPVLSPRVPAFSPLIPARPPPLSAPRHPRTPMGGPHAHAPRSIFASRISRQEGIPPRPRTPLSLHVSHLTPPPPSPSSAPHTPRGTAAPRPGAASCGTPTRARAR